MTRVPTRPALLLALALLTAVAVLAPRPASAMAGRSYGCSFCGHPSNPPWHYSSCRLYRSHSSSSGGYSGGSDAGAALGNAFGTMIDGFFKSIEEAQKAEARRKRLEAERRRQAEIARRRRLEQLRLERIRRARRMRVDWDRREAEMGERLEGVFDPIVGASAAPAPDFEPMPEPDLYVDSSVVDLRPEPGSQRDLESQLRMNPAFLQAQARRAAATDAFATWNYGSVALGSRPEQASQFKLHIPFLPPMPGPPVYWLGRVRSALHGFVDDSARILDPDRLPTAIVVGDTAWYNRVVDERSVRFGECLTGELRITPAELWRARKKTPGKLLDASLPFLPVGAKLKGWSRLEGQIKIGTPAYGSWKNYRAIRDTSRRLEKIVTGSGGP